MSDQIKHFDASGNFSGGNNEIPDPPKEEPEKPLPQNDSNDHKKKRKTLRIMFLGYIIVSIIFIASIAYAMYKSFESSGPHAPTPTNALVSTFKFTQTTTFVPGETSTLLPSETLTPQPSITFTLEPYPMLTVYFNPTAYPALPDYSMNTPYPIPVSSDIALIAETPIITIIVTGDVIITEAPIVLESATMQAMPSSTQILTYNPTRTPTRIKHPCPCSHDLYDCKDFDTHSLAQACYDYCVLTGWGDAHHLDRGNTGIVCKGLP